MKRNNEQPVQDKKTTVESSEKHVRSASQTQFFWDEIAPSNPHALPQFNCSTEHGKVETLSLSSLPGCIK